MLTLTFVMTEETWWKRVRPEVVNNLDYDIQCDWDSWAFKYGIKRMIVLTIDVDEDKAIEITRKVNDILAEEGES